jgi:saccharopine dehydrogenase-like NADP-dependent oxidoreductase
MHRVLLLGAGKIGRMITHLLASTGDYELLVADTNEAALKRLSEQHKLDTKTIDAENAEHLADAMKGCDTVISALSFYYNPRVAELALKSGLNYFDLTEDVATTKSVSEYAQQAAEGQVFMPQCGLAPGFISVVAYHLCKNFDKLDSVRMRVGALSKFPTGQLKYNLTWSTDGLINEYCNPCDAIHDGHQIEVLALEGLEHFSLDGVRYEAFNTSGGLGTLCQTLAGDVRELNYKTIRYMGHREMAVLLVRELDLGQRRDIFKDILEHALPITFQDVVVTFCSVTGWQNDQFVQITDARKIYHQRLHDENWSAIQITTAAGVCAVLDLFIHGKLPNRGFLRQEQVLFEDFMANRFGRLFDSDLTSGPTGSNASLAAFNA